MNIAIEGCLHGELEQVYKQLIKMQKQLNIKIDLLLICGDFQALRDPTDLDYLHCPQKYKSMGTFHKYFQQIEDPPILTIFIGGNHQAVNYMRSLYFGGWIAKNIYYLGQAGSINVRKGSTSIKISGLSGIYNHRDFQYTLRPQKIPLYGGSKISAYHIKQVQVYRIELLSRINLMKRQDPLTYGNQSFNFDIFLTHDWPKNIALYGKTSQLYKYKPFLQKQINSGVFGSPPSQRIMKLAKPTYWFSAHMHIKYAALFAHNENQYTHFLALDKCLQKRSCIQILNLKTQNDQQNIQKQVKLTAQIYLDLEWLTVIHLTQQLQNLGEVLYTFENQQMKLCNTKRMNELIQKFPQVYNILYKKNMKQNQTLIKVPSIDQTEQLKQTQQLLDIAGITKKTNFIGTIFPKSYFMAQQQKKIISEKIHEKNQQKVFIAQVQDQIQLDL